MLTNPFQYQRPLQPNMVINRETEMNRLINGCYSATTFRIDAPRRFGKTSLVRKVLSTAENDGTLGILIDFKGVLTLNDLIVRIGRAYTELSGPLERFLKRQVEDVELKFNIGILGAKTRISTRTINEEGILFSLLDIPNKIAQKGERHIIVCFDEFQDVLQVQAADDKLRSNIQHHDEFVSYIFTGSEPRLMRRLFENKSRAFWEQAEPLPLYPLETDPVVKYLEDKFIQTGKNIGDALVPLVSQAEGHPQRTMFLANKTWELTPGKETADLDIWRAALDNATLQEEPLLEYEWRSFNPNEQRVLRAVALFDGSPYRKESRENTNLPRDNILKITNGLVEDYVLRRIGKGQFVFVDPLFKRYVYGLAT